MLKKVYYYRFELFLMTQVLHLFGSLIFPGHLFERLLGPLFISVNMFVGLLFLLKLEKRKAWGALVLLIVAGITLGVSIASNYEENTSRFIWLGIAFVFYILVTIEIIRQVLVATVVNRTVIYGLISGYISLGFIGFFMFLSIELANTNAFTNLMADSIGEQLLYYSFITLLTIGYGDITPLIPIAQKATILTGLIGQFYMVIVTAVVIEKYIRHSRS